MNSVKKPILKTGIAGLGAIYGVMKCQPQKKRVVILSRQSNKPSEDIILLNEELERRGIDVKILCDKMGDGISGAVRYIGPLLRQMHYLASSKVAVLDSYCIPACLLKKRKGLVVIQMWHALGAMKKFSKSILDMPEGKSSEIAGIMKMHEGYDYIFTSSEKARPAFAEAFGYPEDRLTVMSLPRVDAILDEEHNAELAEKIREKYPELGERKIIGYAPTLRINSGMEAATEALIRAAAGTKYELVLKMHPLTKLDLEGELPENVIIDRSFKTSEWLSVADHVITDYSAITYEVALKGLPLYFYAFDREDYLKDRSFYLDYDRDMPGPICSTAEEVMQEIGSDTRTEEYSRMAKAFADLYIEKQANCTAEIADLIEENL